MDAHSAKHFPILVFPSSLQFCINPREKHKTILTLYNPYTFPVRFSVQSNAPNKYTVVDSSGTIGPSCRVDLVVRHIKPIAQNCNIVDKFKINMYDFYNKKELGHRIVQARLYENSLNSSATDSEDNFEPIVSTNILPEDKIREKKLSVQSWPDNQNRINHIGIGVAIVAGLLLLIPTNTKQEEGSFASQLPVDIISLKLVAAFFLGLATMALLRPV